MSRRKWLVVAGAFLLVIALGVGISWVSLGWLAKRVSDQVMPGLTIEDVRVRWNWIELNKLKFHPPGVEREVLAADSLSLRPTFLSIFSDTIDISTIRIDAPYTYVQRSADGTLKLPFPEQKVGSQDGSKAVRTSVQVGTIELFSGSGEFLDRSVSQPYAHYKLKEVNVRIRNLRYPELDEPIQFAVDSVLEGPKEGQFRAQGWINTSSQTGDFEVEIKNFDIAQVEPYLRGGLGGGEVKSGRVHCFAKIELNRGKYLAAGELRVKDIQLQGSKGSFLGVPTILVGRFLQATGTEMVIPFEIKGDLNKGVKFQAVLVETLAKSFLNQVSSAGLGDVKRGVDIGREATKALKSLFAR